MPRPHPQQAYCNSVTQTTPQHATKDFGVGQLDVTSGLKAATLLLLGFEKYV